MSTSTQKGSLFSALHSLTDEIQTEKQAAARGLQKQAEEPTPSDPGGYQGSSDHPSAHVDNHGAPKKEGARSAENVSDVNMDQGEPGVNKASDAKPGQQDDVQLNIGTQQSATGEDPSVEDDYKGGKEDPGTSHPAATDNSSLDGHKYAGASVSQLHDLHTALSNGILADLANGQGANLTKEAMNAAAGGNAANLNPAASGTGTSPQPPVVQGGSAASASEKAAEECCDDDDDDKDSEGSGEGLSDMIEKAANALDRNNVQNNADVQAGYELAQALGVEEKQAQAAVSDIIGDTINDAHLDATLFGSFYSEFQKSAMEGAAPEDGEDHSGGGDDTSGASDAEGAGGETLGGPAEGGDPLGGGGGGSLGDALGGGSDPGGLMGEDPAAGGGEEAALMELVAALEELGIPIEELAGAGGGAPGMGGGMDGGMGAPPMGGGGPDGGMPPGADMGGPSDPMGGMTEGMKLASAAKAFKRSGRYRSKAAADGSPERALRERMKSHILELMQ